MSNFDFKIIYKKETVIETTSKLVEVDYKNLFVADFLSKEELSQYKILLNSEQFLFENLFQLDIKISNVGIMSFFFKKDSFQKDEIINKIATLKDIPSDTSENKIKKTNKLVKIANEYNPIFACFVVSDQDSAITSNLTDNLFNVVFIKQKQKNTENTCKSQTKLGQFFFKIWQAKVFLIFILLAAFIMTFASYLGVYNCYPNNAIYIFFFICALAGAVLNTFIYKDIYKKYTQKSSLVYVAIVSDLIGYGAGSGAFYGYFIALKGVPESVPDVSKIILIGSIIIFVLLILSYIGSIIFKKILDKKKAKKE